MYIEGRHRHGGPREHIHPTGDDHRYQRRGHHHAAPLERQLDGTRPDFAHQKSGNFRRASAWLYLTPFGPQAT
jgi:hypothetical protein